MNDRCRKRSNDKYQNGEIKEYEQNSSQQSIPFVRIRWMVRRDISDVLEIERGCFEPPWGQDDFLEYFDRRNCAGMVAEIEGQIVGFVIYELSKKRIQVHHLAVHPQYRRQRVGTKLMQRLISKLTEGGRSRITLSIEESNLSAQLFFRHFGFLAISVLRKPFHNTGEDAYIMQYRMRSDLVKRLPKNTFTIIQ